MNKKIKILKEQLILVLPVIIVFLYSFTSYWENDSFISRIFMSIFWALTVEVVAFILYCLVFYFVSYMSGKKEFDKLDIAINKAEVISAIILVVVVYLFGQTNVRKKVNEIKACADEYQLSEEFGKVSELIDYCDDINNDQDESYDSY
ncbi:MAG: hypothetical protein WC693_00545 [Patescibacteria group bacterium]|jgi:hypothetical protein